MVPTSTDTSEAAVRAARELRVVFSRLQRTLRELDSSGDLTPSQISVLARLNKDGATSAAVLASAEGMRAQSMGTKLAALEELGLVERRPDPADGRRRVVSLTAAGRALLGSDRAARQEWLADAMQERFTAAERRTLLEALALLDRLVTP